MIRTPSLSAPPKCRLVAVGPGQLYGREYSKRLFGTSLRAHHSCLASRKKCALLTLFGAIIISVLTVDKTQTVLARLEITQGCAANVKRQQRARCMYYLLCIVRGADGDCRKWNLLNGDLSNRGDDRIVLPPGEAAFYEKGSHCDAAEHHGHPENLANQGSRRSPEVSPMDGGRGAELVEQALHGVLILCLGFGVPSVRLAVHPHWATLGGNRGRRGVPERVVVVSVRKVDIA